MEKEWFKNVEIGEELVYSCWIPGGSIFIMSKVVGKTESGDLKMENDDLVKATGFSRGLHHYEPITDAIRERLKIQEKVEELKSVLEGTNFLELSLEEIEAILKILEGE